MNYLTNYYRNLCEQLQERINVLESIMPRKRSGGMPPYGLPWPMPPSTKNIPVDENGMPLDPNHGPPVSRPQDREQPKDKLGKYDPKKKIAKKDYDKDGKVESSEDEWRGSRDRAIKRSMQNENFNRALGMRPLPEPGGVVQAYAGTPGDGVPDVATYTTAQERAARDQARIRPIDTFGGQYPSPEFGDLARSADSARRAAYPLEGKLREAEIEAQRQHMRTTKYRGRPVSHMSPGSKAYQAAMTAFRTGYQPPEDLAAQLRGSQILSKLSQRILQTHPQYDQFVQDEELRGDIILGRKNSDGTWRQSYLRDRYTGD